MRRLASAVIALLTLSAVADSAIAQGVVSGAIAPAAPIDPIAERTELMSAVIAEIDARASRVTDPLERTLYSQLNGFYRMAGSKVRWVGNAGLSPSGEALHEELRTADLYGLDPLRFSLPSLPIDARDVRALASAEADLAFSAVEYAAHAHGGRLDPSQLSRWLDQRPRSIYVSDVYRQLDVTGDVVAVLRSYHPKHPQFEMLRQAYLAERGVIEQQPVIAIPAGAVLKRGDRSGDVPLIRQRLKLPARDVANEDLLDGELLLRVREFMYENGYGRVKIVEDRVRAALSRPDRIDVGSKKALLDKYIINMERWRWMPEDMGRRFVWNNLPEFETKMFRDGEIIHRERIIIGKPHTQTPIFSDTMVQVVFQPEWGVPESIKLSSILPHMRGGDTGVLERRNMRIVGKNGKAVSPSKFNWSKVDIRSVPIVQGPGPGNPLGRLKFLFPNGHDVYMHDTPDKYLFEDKERTFSHGCIRVRNPDRFAEVVLGEIEGWSGADVATQLKDKKTFTIDLREFIQVHNTYFTLVANADGSVTNLKDIYAHDRRVGDALLAGKSIKLIAAGDPALAQWKQNQELRKNGGAIYKAKPRAVADLKPFPPFGAQGVFNQAPVKFKPTKYMKAPYNPNAPSLLWFKY